VWRARTILLLSLLAIGAAFGLIVLGASSGAVASPPASTSAGCRVTYHPIGLVPAACAVPSGGTIDICAIVTAGLVSCPIHLVDLNPADWLAWFGCTILSDVSLLWSSILPSVASYVASYVGAALSGLWNDITLYVGSFLETIVQDLINAVTAPFHVVLNALSGAITYVIQAVGNALIGFFAAVEGVAQGTGPFAPIIVVTLTMLIFLLGGIGLYYAIIFLFAVGKTIFNLL
jgi:hypothetical protein